MSEHPIVHFELSAGENNQAPEFYQSIFGWEMQHVEEMSYTMFSTGPDELGGGFNPVSVDNPAGTVLIYIGTDDIDATLAAIEAKGGKPLVPKTEIPGFGWFAHFKDPAGNLVGLYTALSQAGTG